MVRELGLKTWSMPIAFAIGAKRGHAYAIDSTANGHNRPFLNKILTLTIKIGQFEIALNKIQ
jgi:hypothetical protein